MRMIYVVAHDRQVVVWRCLTVGDQIHCGMDSNENKFCVMHSATACIDCTVLEYMRRLVLLVGLANSEWWTNFVDSLNSDARLQISYRLCNCLLVRMQPVAK